MSEVETEEARVARGLRDLGFDDDTPREVLDSALAIVERLEAAKAAFVSEGRELLARSRRQVFKLTSPDHAHHFLVHLSSSQGGKWQLTRMEGNEPTGHVLFDTSADAIGSATGKFVRGVAPIGDASFRVEGGAKSIGEIVREELNRG